jgi:hypothetical protein
MNMTGSSWKKNEAVADITEEKNGGWVTLAQLSELVRTGAEITKLRGFFFGDRVSLCNPGWPWTHYVTYTGQEPVILPCQPPECWDYRYVPPCHEIFLSILVIPLNKEAHLCLCRQQVICLCLFWDIAKFFLIICIFLYSLVCISVLFLFFKES